MVHRLAFIIIFIFTIGCYDDSYNGEDLSSIRGVNLNTDNTSTCSHSKMDCIENRAQLCWENEWILIDDCNLSESICHFNEPELSYNIPFFAICVIE